MGRTIAIRARHRLDLTPRQARAIPCGPRRFDRMTGGIATMLLEGTTMVVSGVGPGLGREIAEAAGRDGASVVIGARIEANLKAAAEAIDPTGERVAFRVTDITKPDDCDALVD